MQARALLALLVLLFGLGFLNWYEVRSLSPLVRGEPIHVQETQAMQSGVTVTESWQSDGKTVTVTTTRYVDYDGGAINGETRPAWKTRHETEVAATLLLFPKD